MEDSELCPYHGSGGVAGKTRAWTTNYESYNVTYGSGYHRMFRSNLSYSFGYGKRIERGNELEGGVSISSGLVN